MKVLRQTMLGVLFFLVAAVLLAPAGGFAQQQASPEPVNQSDDPLLRDFVFRSIGPATMGGRIDDIEALDADPFTYYIGLATGGVWKTTNNGTTWAPIFDTYPVSSIGDIAVSQQNPDVVWVGTGEPNNRQSSSFGAGIYKSVDGGANFALMGLEETQTIARVVIDPTDDDTVFVAANGHLFGPNPDRGVYKTTDGGASWRQVAYVDESTGFTDLAIDPSDPNILYAASYQRQRTPWGFNGGGSGSGLWKSTDSGETWTRLRGNGLPEDPDIGRIGLSVYRADPNVVYAQIEVGVRRPGRGGRGPQDPEAPPPPPDPARSGVWRSEDKGASWRIMSNNNNRPMYYSQIRVDPTDDRTIWTMGASLYKSIDGGRSFEVVRGMGHGDHHAMWINPTNGDHVLLGNDGGFNVSYDGGASWDFINMMALGQFYAIGVDMQRPYHVYGGLQDNGSWGAPSMTRNNNGILNEDWYRVGGGDGFYVRVDPTDPNVVYVESQGGNIGRLDLATGVRTNIRPRARRGPGGGGRGGGPDVSNIVPEPPAGTQYRFNWNTPIELSPHNPDTVYTGANVFFKSVDRGDTWTASADLTRQIDRDTLEIMGVSSADPMVSKNDGQSNYGNITAIGESPIMPGLIWVGTDDGHVQVSRDGGVSFTNLSDRIPGLTAGHKVTRVEPSHHEAETAYVSFDGHMSDDHAPYLFVTRDAGQTWEGLAAGLPDGNIRVVREDPRNPEVLFIGTEYALYVSLDGGGEWSRFMSGMPTVRVDDMIIHPRDNDLIVGTHGRSILIVDDITPLQQLTDEVRAADAHLFDVRPGVLWKNDITQARYVTGTRRFRGANPPFGTAVSYYLRADLAEPVRLIVTDLRGDVVRTMEGPGDAGINRVQWDLRRDAPELPEGAPQGGRGGGRGGQRVGPLVEAGAYVITLMAGGTETSTTVVVEEDVWMGQ